MYTNLIGLFYLPQIILNIINIIYIYFFLTKQKNNKCYNKKAKYLVLNMKNIPGGILQTVAGCHPYLWLQLGDCTKILESLRHSAKTSPPI